MRTLTQTVLSFKVEATEELLTANAGLALFGEFTQSLGLHRWLTQEMPLPGSGRGYKCQLAMPVMGIALCCRGWQQRKPDISALQETRHFCLALTGIYAVLQTCSI